VLAITPERIKDRAFQWDPEILHPELRRVENGLADHFGGESFAVCHNSGEDAAHCPRIAPIVLSGLTNNAVRTHRELRQVWISDHCDNEIREAEVCVKPRVAMCVVARKRGLTKAALGQRRF